MNFLFVSNTLLSILLSNLQPRKMVSITSTITLSLISVISFILILGFLHRIYEWYSTNSQFSPAAKFIIQEKDSFVVFSLLNLLYSLGQVEVLHKHVISSQQMSYITALFIVWMFPFTYCGAIFDSLVVLKTCSPDFATTRRVIRLKQKNETVFKTRESLKYGSMMFSTVAAMAFHAFILQQTENPNGENKVMMEVYKLYSLVCYLLVILVLIVYTRVGAWKGLKAVENTLNDAEIDQNQQRLFLTPQFGFM